MKRSGAAKFLYRLDKISRATEYLARVVESLVSQSAPAELIKRLDRLEHKIEQIYGAQMRRLGETAPLEARIVALESHMKDLMPFVRAFDWLRRLTRRKGEWEL